MRTMRKKVAATVMVVVLGLTMALPAAAADQQYAYFVVSGNQTANADARCAERGYGPSYFAFFNPGNNKTYIGCYVDDEVAENA